MNNLEDVTYEVKDGVAVISLNRPQALNAFTQAMGRGLKQAVADAVADAAVRVIVLTGTGRGFCAGADMNLLQKIAPGGIAHSLQLPILQHRGMVICAEVVSGIESDAHRAPVGIDARFINKAVVKRTAEGLAVNGSNDQGFVVVRRPRQRAQIDLPGAEKHLRIDFGC